MDEWHLLCRCIRRPIARAPPLFLEPKSSDARAAPATSVLTALTGGHDPGPPLWTRATTSTSSRLHRSHIIRNVRFASREVQVTPPRFVLTALRYSLSSPTSWGRNERRSSVFVSSALLARALVVGEFAYRRNG